MTHSASSRLAMQVPLHAMVFTGGVAALSWEVLWQHSASLALGISALGTAITRAVTMAGLRAGSLLAGRWLPGAGSLPPLRIYGVLEAVIGFSGLAMLPGFRLLERLDAAGLERNAEMRTRNARQYRAGIALDGEALARYAALAEPVTDDNQRLDYGSLGDLLAYGPSMTRANLALIAAVAGGEAAPALPGPAAFARFSC